MERNYFLAAAEAEPYSSDSPSEMNLDYWDRFYKESDQEKPSSFAIFLYSRGLVLPSVTEFGCGSGQDSKFFAHTGSRVLAVDRSKSAIGTIERQKIQGVFAECIDVGSFDCLQGKVVAHKRQESMLFYSRFFLHSIDVAREDALLAIVSAALDEGDRAAFEYRTTQDAVRKKIYADHARRFIDHSAFLSKCEGLGFNVYYESESSGVSVYKSEDPVLGRVVFGR